MHAWTIIKRDFVLWINCVSTFSRICGEKWVYIYGRCGFKKNCVCSPTIKNAPGFLFSQNNPKYESFICRGSSPAIFNARVCDNLHICNKVIHRMHYIACLSKNEPECGYCIKPALLKYSYNIVKTTISSSLCTFSCIHTQTLQSDKNPVQFVYCFQKRVFWKKKNLVYYTLLLLRKRSWPPC